MRTISNIGTLNQIKREFIAEANQLINNPRGVLALCTCYMELIVNSIIKERCRKVRYLTKETSIPLKAKLLLLYELGMIDNSLFEDVSLLIDQRNSAVHRFDWNFDRGIIRRLKYLKKPANKYRLQEIKGKSQPWANICFDLLSEIGDVLRTMVIKPRKQTHRT